VNVSSKASYVNDERLFEDLIRPSLKHWFRGRLSAILESLLQDSVAASDGWIRVAPVRRMIDEQRRGASHETRLWLVLWLELWLRHSIGKASAADLKWLLEKGPARHNVLHGR
jgi:hypothetical protein